MKKLIFGGIAVVAILVWKFVIGPSLAVTASNTAGMGWNDAKPELAANFQATFAKDFASFELGPANIKTLSDCCAEKAVAFLNTTDCSYLYNQTTTSEAEHTKNQEACLAKVKYTEQEEKIGLACLLQHFPNDWKHLKNFMREAYEASFAQSGMSAADIKKTSQCLADGSVKIANQRKCQVVNKQATNLETLFNNFDTCMKEPGKDAEFEALMASCGGVITTGAAPGAAGTGGAAAPGTGGAAATGAQGAGAGAANPGATPKAP
jgi:hypothetical protein